MDYLKEFEKIAAQGMKIFDESDMAKDIAKIKKVQEIQEGLKKLNFNIILMQYLQSIESQN